MKFSMLHNLNQHLKDRIRGTESVHSRHPSAQPRTAENDLCPILIDDF